MSLNQDLDEEYYNEPGKPVCEQDQWMQMSATDAFAAFTVANVNVEQPAPDDNMQMDCGVCEPANMQS